MTCNLNIVLIFIEVLEIKEISESSKEPFTSHLYKGPPLDGNVEDDFQFKDANTKKRSPKQPLNQEDFGNTFKMQKMTGNKTFPNLIHCDVPIYASNV